MNNKRKEEAIELREVRQSSGPVVYRSNNVGCGCGSSVFWGFILLFVGTFWLGQNIGWIDPNISMWPILIIVIGFYIIFVRFRAK